VPNRTEVHGEDDRQVSKPPLCNSFYFFSPVHFSQSTSDTREGNIVSGIFALEFTGVWYSKLASSHRLIRWRTVFHSSTTVREEMQWNSRDMFLRLLTSTTQPDLSTLKTHTTGSLFFCILLLFIAICSYWYTEFGFLEAQFLAHSALRLVPTKAANGKEKNKGKDWKQTPPNNRRPRAGATLDFLFAADIASPTSIIA